MQQSLQITFRGMDPSEAVESRIRAKAEELERFDEHITSCRVTVEAPHRHHHKGHLYSVHIDLRLPGQEIVVGRERHRHHAHEDVYVAIRDAFEAAARQVQDYSRKRRGQVKQHDLPPHGVVGPIFRDDGYGFVTMPDGSEVYFHENSVTGGTFSALETGDPVRVVVAEGEGDKGPQASAVTPFGKRHAAGEGRA